MSLLFLYFIIILLKSKSIHIPTFIPPSYFTITCEKYEEDKTKKNKVDVIYLSIKKIKKYTFLPIHAL